MRVEHDDDEVGTVGEPLDHGLRSPAIMGGKGGGNEESASA
jgi:hypothetical protein